MKLVTLNFFAFLTHVTHYLTAVKIKKKIYRLENFRVNVPNNGIFTLKTHHMFSVYTTLEEFCICILGRL